MGGWGSCGLLVTDLGIHVSLSPNLAVGHYEAVKIFSGKGSLVLVASHGLQIFYLPCAISCFGDGVLRVNYGSNLCESFGQIFEMQFSKFHINVYWDRDLVKS